MIWFNVMISQAHCQFLMFKMSCCIYPLVAKRMTGLMI